MQIEKPHHILGIAAGKGGVGKSSISVLLAQALIKQGFKVGLLDADIYGPSLCLMLPATKMPIQTETGLIPAYCGDLSYISMGFFIPPNKASIIRAPKANAIISQFLQGVNWGGLDFLLIDFPPGTGDIQLTMMQEITLNAAILVTTPQEVATQDVLKAAYMFQSMNVPLMGVIENMSYLMIDGLSTPVYPFGKGGGEKISKALGIPLLGKVPLEEKISKGLDQGLNLFDQKDILSSIGIIEKVACEIPSRFCQIEEHTASSLKEINLMWK